MTNFNNLPIEIQTNVKNTLRAFNKCDVWFEYGQYRVLTGACLKATYGADHKYIGTYKADEIFTEEERIENYINGFCDYPIEYKGKRDYGMLRKMTNEREIVKDENGKMKVAIWQGKLNAEGTFELTHKALF